MTTPFAITHVTVLVGDAAGSTLEDTTVLVDETGTIADVGVDIPVPRGTRKIDGSRRFLSPGLINAHAHLFSDGKPLPAFMTGEKTESLVATFMHSPAGKVMLYGRAKRNILTQMNSGVTTIRSLGDVRYEAVKVRNEIEAGKYLGPRVLPSGPLLAATGGHGTPSIALVNDDPWTARRNVRANLRKGTTAIKIAATGGVTDARAIGEAGRPQMTEEEMAAICDEAHNAGVVVAAHAQSPEGLRRCLHAGVDTIEHGSSMTDEIIELFMDNPNSLHGSSALVPTLMACLPLVKLDPSKTGIDHIVRANAEMIYEEMLAGITAAHENGITIGMGTDSGLTYVTHYNTWREIEFISRFGGLSPAEALHAATQANARMLGLSDITGSIEAGKQADLVLLRTNPLEDAFRAYDAPKLISVRGELIEEPTVEHFPDIDATLDQI